MSHEDLAWLERRAEEEILRASEATDEQAVAFHYTLANLYLDQLFSNDGDGRPGEPQ
jgi:hypothetical protein